MIVVLTATVIVTLFKFPLDVTLWLPAVAGTVDVVVVKPKAATLLANEGANVLTTIVQVDV